MDTLELKAFSLGELATNCYLIFNRGTKKGFIVDFPYPSDEVEAFIHREKLDILYIAITHVHFDHIGGLNNFYKPFYIHRDDLPLLKDANLNGSSFFLSPFIVEREPLLYNNLSLYFDSSSLEVIHTPGHTPGSVSLKLRNWLFSGDTIFFHSLGRTDIPLASHSLLLKSVKEKLLSLPANTEIYPGHGPPTTVKIEREGNPFLNVKEIIPCNGQG